MKVVHIHRIGGIGGSERHLLTLLPALGERGVEVRFVGLDDPSRAPDPFYEHLAAPFERIPAPRDFDPMLAVRIRRAVRRARPDIVHTHLVHADLYGAFGGGAVVSTKHNDDPFRTGAYRFVERALARRASCIIAITESLARFQIERVGLPARKVVTVHYGLDTLPPAWGTNPPDDVAPTASVALAVCRLERQKGLDVAIRALAIARSTEPRLELVVLGEGREREALASLAGELGVPVHLLGRVPDVGAWLARAAVLVHPVRWEGFGLAVLEAMLAGLPVVASRVSSLPELVEDGVTGRLVTPDDPVGLAGALTETLGEGRAYGAAGRRRAQERFSVARMADATLGVYRDAIGLQDVASAHHPPPARKEGGARA